jgi:CDP-diacylglycerol--glycerol-3-phosphate 3-phosphatidyltransferase
MNLPNKLTLFRIFLIPIVIALLIFKLNYFAAGVFILASITDALDGYIARKHNLITDFGKIADPLADKLLVMSVTVFFTVYGHIHFIILIILIFRDTLIDGLRIVAAGKNIILAAGFSGKIKTAIQMVSLIWIMTDNFPFQFFNIDIRFDYILFYISVFFSIYSGVEYIVKNRSIFNDR